ncbi:MAG: PEGA domain-containing protein [Bacteroidota bacterium]
MKKISLLFTLFVILSGVAFAQKKVIFTTVPSDAGIYIKQNGTYTLIAQGSFELKLSKDEIKTIMVWKEGYEPFLKSYTKSGGGELEERVILDTRVVKITAAPFNAEVYADGVFTGKGGNELDIPVKKNTSVNLEIKGEGFKSIKRTYYNNDGKEAPPIKESIELVDRIVRITSDPPGSVIYTDGNLAGETTTDITISKNSCVNVKITKDGYAPIEKSYCNKTEAATPPKSESFTLKDRLVQINTTPEDANIRIDGKVVGKGSYILLIKRDQCTEAEIIKDGFDTNKKTYCNKSNMSEPPVTDHIKLTEDEAWLSSISSDQANVNFAINVNPKLGNDAAWKIISQIVMEKFDVIEITDPVTGYIRTAWNVKIFGNGKTIRTRCIVKLGSSDPLRYVVKIVSEQSTVSGTSVKEDENFKEWDRLLNIYKDIISEIQARIN